MSSSSIILVPTYSHLEPETDEILRKLEQRGYLVQRRFGIPIDQARAIMATEAIVKGYDWLFWIDSDIHFTVKDFLALEAMEGPFCCAPYKQKVANEEALAILSDEREGIVDANAAGFGFMKTHRSIYEAMIKELPICHQDDGDSHILIPFFQPRYWEIEGGRYRYYGEDYSFCLRAKALGFQLKANFDIKIGHIGRYSYRIGEPWL